MKGGKEDGLIFQTTHDKHDFGLCSGLSGVAIINIRTYGLNQYKEILNYKFCILIL